MPTLYTTLRAQHRHSLPRRAPLQAMAAPASRKRPLLTLAQGMMNRAAPSVEPRPLTKAVKKQGRFIVIGAGLAGLSVAYELQGLGYEVTVYEARDRVGGRVHSLTDEFIPGKTVEGGGELIGSNHPLWNAYAEHFGLGFTDVSDYGNSPIRIGKKTLSFEESKKLTDELEKQLKALSDLAETVVDPFQPWMNSNAAQLDQESLAGWIRRAKCSALCKTGLREMLETDNGVPAEGQSMLGILAMVKGGGLDRYWTDTETYRCAGGNEQLAAKFCECLNRKITSVITGAAVREVIRRGEKVFVTIKKNGKREKLAPVEEVVLAIPPSVWGTIRFNESALARMLKRAPRMGANVKFLMRFSRRFWEDFASSPNLTEDGPIDLTWEATEADKGRDFAMVGFSGAADASRLSKLGSKRVRKPCVRELEIPYPGIGQQIKRSRLMNWPKEEWTKASYYFPRPGEVTRWGPFWQAGYGGWLHFAGEHTSYAFMGYMEGALSSGFRLARKIAVRDGVLAG